MSSNEHSSGGGGFSHGFLIGAIIGGALVFLLGTKKGKNLLKTITEEGLEVFSGFEDFIEDEADYENTQTAMPQKEKSHEEATSATNGSAVSSKEEDKPRRFFRRVIRKN